jgi:hypothetical protein
MALSKCVKEAIYLQRFLRELGFDKNAALKLAENPTFHARSKNIYVRLASKKTGTVRKSSVRFY